MELECVPHELLLSGEHLISVEGCLLVLNDHLTLDHCTRLCVFKRLIERFHTKLRQLEPRKAHIISRVRQQL